MKHLFLQGPIGAGKSSLIREVILPHLHQVGGFYVQRLFTGAGLKAFSLNQITIPEGYSLNQKVERFGGAGEVSLSKYLDGQKDEDQLVEGPGKVFLYCGDDGRWQFRLDVFEIFGAGYLSKSEVRGKKLLLLDEVGGVELQCPTFLQALLETLDGDIPCLGVLKAENNSKNLDRCLADQSNNITTRKPHLQKLIDHPKIKLLDFQPETGAPVKNLVRKFVEEAMAK